MIRQVKSYASAIVLTAIGADIKIGGATPKTRLRLSHPQEAPRSASRFHLRRRGGFFRQARLTAFARMLFPKHPA
jgi:hypothetical protein